MSKALKHYIQVVFRATDANALSSPYSVGVPAVVAQGGFVDRLRFAVGDKVNITGFATSYFDPSLSGMEESFDKRMQKLRVGFCTPVNKIDEGDTAPPTSPRISAQFQLILEVEGGTPSASIEAVRGAMMQAGVRFCGGSLFISDIQRCNLIENSKDLWSGYFIVDATHKIAEDMANHPGRSGIESLYVLTHSHHPARPDLFGDRARTMRFYPNTLGYIALQAAPTIRPTHFGEWPHRFAESAVGIVYEVFTTPLKEVELPFGELMDRLVFRKSFDAHGSMYFKQSAPLFPSI